MKTPVVVFPFELFGSGGTGDGARNLGDVVQEIIDDTAAEERPIRQHSFAEYLAIEELEFNTPETIASWRSAGRTLARRLLDDDQFFVWLGGNHLSVLPLLEELPSDTLVVQFDAHLDIFAFSDCAETLSHGNFLLHAEESLPKMINVGSRDLFLEKKEWRKHFLEVYAAEGIAASMPTVLADIQKRTTRAKSIWIDIDVDVFDPAFAPGVTTPSPFGLDPLRFLALFQAVWGKGTRVLGVSLSEYCPARDRDDRTLELLGWFLERLFLLRSE